MSTNKMEHLDFRESVRLAGVCFFYLSLLMLFLLYFGGRIQKILESLMPWFKSETREKKKLPDSVLAEQRTIARKKLQEDHESKAEGYKERVLLPREEAKKADLEKEFYRFAGPAWKGRGERTRSDEDSNSGTLGEGLQSRPALRRRDLEGTSRDAAIARRLPEAATNPPRPLPPQGPEPKQAKQVIELPEEPEHGSPECITVIMRGITGQRKTRRFLYTQKVQVLFDWMMKLGYHEKLYTLVTVYPRRDLSQHARQETLQEVGIDSDAAIAVEEIERDVDS
ncbi:UBX domain-containing protein 8-like [Diadema setosum]|uniref:UBX domain-containing protein 8-like n=1 Tax=Diadema setosum TaxID=31175 RepID=UPI003B3BE0D9